MRRHLLFRSENTLMLFSDAKDVGTQQEDWGTLTGRMRRGGKLPRLHRRCWIGESLPTPPTRNPQAQRPIDDSAHAGLKRRVDRLRSPGSGRAPLRAATGQGGLVIPGLNRTPRHSAHTPDKTGSGPERRLGASATTKRSYPSSPDPREVAPRARRRQGREGSYGPTTPIAMSWSPAP